MRRAPKKYSTMQKQKNEYSSVKTGLIRIQNFIINNLKGIKKVRILTITK